MTLRLQILSLLSVTILITAISIVAAAWYNTAQYARTQIDTTIQTATDTFKQQLRSREDQLINSAELLTSDFGFKQAVATQDTPTINSALFNHGDRVKADLMFLTNLDGQLQASTHSALQVRQPFPHIDLIEAAAYQGGALSFVRVGDTLYQLVIVTVVAPVPIGFSGVGFSLDQDIAEELKRLANIEVTFVTSTRTGKRVTSTLPVDQVEMARSAPSSLDSLFSVPFLDNNPFITSQVELKGADPDLGTAYLSVPVAPYLQDFQRLLYEILAITLGALMLSSLLSLTITRGMTRPLHQLAGIAGRISKGDYQSVAVPAKGSREILQLFNAVSTMGRDIKEREEHIAFQAEHDNLTRLYNRMTFVRELSPWLANQSEQAVVVCINIRGFRAINDSFGPVTGDHVLQTVAKRLEASAGVQGLLGRYGGDEFVAALPLSEMSAARQSIQDLITPLEEPVKQDELELNLAFTVGFALYPVDGTVSDQLVRRATIALDSARTDGATVRQYVDGEEEAQGHKLKLTRDLRAAIEADDGQLFMNYQPKMRLSDNHVDKMEALIRWIHPEEGFISPELFIALAEQSNLIMRLTDWVVSRVIRDRTRWQELHPDLQIAINVSAQDLERDDLLDATLAQLKDHGLGVRALCFEMTERDMMQDSEKAFGIMQAYREAGFDLSVDDYGIGQSSLSKLKQMPVNEIKIDKLFVMHLDESEDDQTIVASTIKLGHDFNLRVIAEGVETAGAVDMLRQMGCDYIQGYHLSRPMKAEDADEWLAEARLKEQEQNDPRSEGEHATTP